MTKTGDVTSDLFVDRLGNVAIVDGVARLDFLRLMSVDPETNKAKMEPALRVAIPLQGFVQVVDMLDKLRAELLRQQAQAGTPPERQSSGLFPWRFLASQAFIPPRHNPDSLQEPS